MIGNRPTVAGTTAVLLLAIAAHADCPGPGDCFVEHANPGCSNNYCCTLVCSVDAFCCDVLWDLDCAAIAGGLCRATVGPFVNPCNNSSYYLLPPGSWTDSVQLAAALGGSLATITSEEENEFVRQVVVGYDGETYRRAWIGYYLPPGGDEFVWVSGEPGCYTNWYPGEPNFTFIDKYTELWVADGGWNNNLNFPTDGGPVPFAVAEVPAAPPCPADLNHDGVVDGADLGLLLSSWGLCTP